MASPLKEKGFRPRGQGVKLLRTEGGFYFSLRFFSKGKSIELPLAPLMDHVGSQLNMSLLIIPLAVRGRWGEAPPNPKGIFFYYLKKPFSLLTKGKRPIIRALLIVFAI